VSRKWRKAKATKAAGTPVVPYGPPPSVHTTPSGPSRSTMKSVALVGATIAAPYILRGLFKLLSKR
jgi:hypothetical protein